MSGPCSRRQLLRLLGVGSAGGLAGCNVMSPSTERPTEVSTKSPTSRPPTPDTDTRTETPTATETPTETETATETATPDGQPPTDLVRTEELPDREGGQLAGVFTDLVFNDGEILSAGSVDGAIWLVAFDTNLDVEWSRIYSGWGPGRDGVSVNVASDGGYLVGAVPQADTFDVGVVKTDSRGELEWERRFEARSGTAHKVWFLELGGGTHLCAWTNLRAEGGDAYFRGFEGPDGPLRWEKDYNSRWIGAIHRTEDGGWLVDGAKIDYETWIKKFGPDGTAQWRLTPDSYYAAHPTPTGYVLWNGSEDEVRIRSLDQDRTELWTKTYDEPGSELRVVEPTADGGYLLAGQGDEGMWVTVIGPDGGVQSSTKYGIAPGREIEPVGLASEDGHYVTIGEYGDRDYRDDGWVISVVNAI